MFQFVRIPAKPSSNSNILKLHVQKEHSSCIKPDWDLLNPVQKKSTQAENCDDQSLTSGAETHFSG